MISCFRDGSKMRILHRRILICIFSTQCLMVIALFFCPAKEKDYKHVEETKIRNKLFMATSPHLVNRSNIDCNYEEILTSTKILNISEAPEIYNFSSTGIVNGTYIPEHCNPAFSVAILVTYRNRKNQLQLFKTYMHGFLRKQNIHYKIYVIQQRDRKPWNKGLLYNIGAKQAIADEFPCLILHDVDLLPLNERNLYVCTRQPRHMSACVDKFQYRLPYDSLVGGVLAIRSDQFEQVNGFSNRFYGWGAEDDDFATRMEIYGLKLIRFPRSMSQYMMLSHGASPINHERYRILEENRRLTGEGLRSVNYTRLEIRQLTFFTWIRVHI